MHEPVLPSADALWAATLALMTTTALADADAAAPCCPRELIARKIVSNLERLARHPALPDPLRLIVARARCRWCTALAASSRGPRPVAAAAGDTRH